MVQSAPIETDFDCTYDILCSRWGANTVPATYALAYVEICRGMLRGWKATKKSGRRDFYGLLVKQVTMQLRPVWIKLRLVLDIRICALIPV